MRLLRVAIVDDEALARARLRRLLAADPNLVICGDYECAATLAAGWAGAPADLLLTDIAMPECDGFDALRQLQPPPASVVFVTAYAQHALRAFTIAATDYLLKPVEPERLRETLQRVRERLRSDVPTPGPRYAERLALPIGRRLQLIAVDSIDYVVAQANYVELHAAGRSFVVRKTLTALQTELDPQRFARIHRSLLVRLGGVAEIEPLDSARYRLRLESGATLLSGRGYCEVLRQRFGLRAD